MLNDNLQLAGEVKLVLKDKAGNIKDTREIKNLVVSAGLTFIASRMVGTAKAVMSHMALGSNAAAAVAANTDLGTMLGIREAMDSTTQTANQIVYVSAFEAGDATGAVVEAGVFNAASGGDMLCRTTFPVVNKGVDDTMSVTWTITLSAV